MRCYPEGDGLELSVVWSSSSGLLKDELVVGHPLARWTGQLLLDQSMGVHRRVGCKEREERK